MHFCCSIKASVIENISNIKMIGKQEKPRGGFKTTFLLLLTTLWLSYGLWTRYICITQFKEIFYTYVNNWYSFFYEALVKITTMSSINLSLMATRRRTQPLFIEASARLLSIRRWSFQILFQGMFLFLIQRKRALQHVAQFHDSKIRYHEYCKFEKWIWSSDPICWS